jgi:hypothetical protein
VRDGFEKGIHVELILHAGFLAVSGCGRHEASVGVEKGGEAANESGADLISAEGDWADKRDGV